MGLIRIDFVLALLLLIGAAYSVEVHFENKDSGFFLKHTPRAGSVVSVPSPGVSGALLSLDRFTVLLASEAAAVRATYGPFSTKQTVPARYSVPEPPAPPTPSGNASILAQAGHRLDVSAHAVTREISRDSPVLRVLFHAGTEAGGAGSAAARRVCVTLHAAYSGRALSASCAPAASEAGACLAEITIPAEWWGPAALDSRGTPAKRPPKTMKLSYGAAEGAPGSGSACSSARIQPVWPLGVATLVAPKTAHRELRSGAAGLLLPRAPLYPRSRMHVPIVVHYDAADPIRHIVIKARVKSGLRLLGVSSSSSRWDVRGEVKARAGTVTAVRRDPPVPSNYPAYPADDDFPLPITGDDVTEEVLTLLVEAEGGRGGGGGEGAGAGAGRLVWNARCSSGAPQDEGEEASSARNTARFDIDKDDIQAVLPISKSWEVLNTAAVTGRQVSQAMKVLIVSQAGKVADVTLQSSCHSEDESVLKVSSSCSSVYVDGSEVRGSSNASVIAKYGTYTGLAKFTVWMPEFPLEVDVDDFRLSQIKGWKVPDDTQGGKSRSPIANSLVERPNCRMRHQQSPVEIYARFLATDHDSGRVSYFVSRRTWLKITDLVMSLMRVSDPRIASLHGRILQGRTMGRTEVQVLSPITGRVIGAREVRVVSDKVTVSNLLVRVISGLQLNISPDNAIDNGYVSETTVTRRLTAQYQEGLLDIDIEFSDGSKTPLRDVDVADYYLLVESLDPEVVAFAPMAASHHPRVIAVGEGSGELLQVSLLTSEECRVGPLRRLQPSTGALGKAEKGSASVLGALATTAANVEVDFTVSDVQRPDTPQNDDIMARGGMKSALSDLRDILIGVPMKEQSKQQASAVQARQYGSLVVPRTPFNNNGNAHLTPVEIGMYVLLGAFCLAIMVFVVSCMVYASKFKPSVGEPLDMAGGRGVALQTLHGEPQGAKLQVAGLVGTARGFGRDNSETTINAHDWVWLGRATIERNNGRPVKRTTQSNVLQQPANDPNGNKDIRITSNPLNFNYMDPDDAIVAKTGNRTENSSENPKHINLPAASEMNGNRRENDKVIDSRTYCKRSSKVGRPQSTDNGHWQAIAPPPPPHGAGAPSLSEYRPPVPPHRRHEGQEPSSHRILADTIMPPTRRQHMKHHKRASRPGLSSAVQAKDLYNENSNNCSMSTDWDKRPDNLQSLQLASHDECAAMFSFDAPAPPTTPASSELSAPPTREQRSPDEMQDSGIGLGDVQLRHKPQHSRQRDSNRECAITDDFVQNNGGTSPEVKRATIIGNPMYSELLRAKGVDISEAPPVSATGEPLSLHELEMDYNQIMHYFHNLKESNA